MVHWDHNCIYDHNVMNTVVTYTFINLGADVLPQGFTPVRLQLKLPEKGLKLGQKLRFWLLHKSSTRLGRALVSCWHTGCQDCSIPRENAIGQKDKRVR